MEYRGTEKVDYRRLVEEKKEIDTSPEVRVG